MFRTIEFSDPQYESHNLRFITVKSNNLKGRGDICLFLPPLLNVKNIPLVILLHGVYGSAWHWAYKGGAHIAAWEMMEKKEIQPMVIAMPSDGLWGDGSAYLPHHGCDFEKWIVDDVPEAVKEQVTAVSSSSDVFISGLSMGGFGALRLGAKYGHRYRAISAHSSITAMEQMSLFVEEPLEKYGKSKSYSVIETIKEHKEQLPDIRFDCGTEDFLIAHNRRLHEQLNQAEVPHVYQEFPGGHEWPYWQEHIKDSLRFFNSCNQNR